MQRQGLELGTSMGGTSGAIYSILLTSLGNELEELEEISVSCYRLVPHFPFMNNTIAFSRRRQDWEQLCRRV